MGSVGWSSDIGTERGLPYTAALLMYTNLLTPERADAWSMFTVPSTFVWASVAGSSVDRSTLTTAKLEDTAIATYTLRDPENEQSFFKIDVYARPEHKPLGAPWTNNSDNEIQIGETTLRGYLRNFDDMGFAPDPAIIVPFVDFYVYARSDFTGQDGKVPEKLIEFVKGLGLLPD